MTQPARTTHAGRAAAVMGLGCIVLAWKGWVRHVLQEIMARAAVDAAERTTHAGRVAACTVVCLVCLLVWMSTWVDTSACSVSKA